jgi:hypothetical protein
MNKQNLERHLAEVEEIFVNTTSVKGDDFANMVRFVGTMQSFVRLVLSEMADVGAGEEQLDTCAKRCALFASALCDAHGHVLGLTREEFTEVFKIVDSIDDRVRKALED